MRLVAIGLALAELLLFSAAEAGVLKTRQCEGEIQNVAVRSELGVAKLLVETGPTESFDRTCGCLIEFTRDTNKPSEYARLLSSGKFSLFCKGRSSRERRTIQTKVDANSYTSSYSISTMPPKDR